MAWLGFVTLLTIYWCFFVAATTGRIGWCLLTGWLLPILALTISFRKGMQVNGLMVLICFVLFLVCRSGLAEQGKNYHEILRHYYTGISFSILE